LIAFPLLRKTLRVEVFHVEHCYFVDLDNRQIRLLCGSPTRRFLARIFMLSSPRKMPNERLAGICCAALLAERDVVGVADYAGSRT
jgi:hypothetical protein